MFPLEPGGEKSTEAQLTGHLWTIPACPPLCLSLPPFSDHVSPPLTYASSMSAPGLELELAERPCSVAGMGWTPLSFPPLPWLGLELIPGFWNI